MGLREINIDLTDEHIALRNAAKKFLEEVWRPAAIELDKLPDPLDVIAERFALWGVLNKTWELGYHKMAFPKSLGGMELDTLSIALISEEMGWAAPDLAVCLAVCMTPFAYAQLSPDPEVRDLTRKFCKNTMAKMTGCWAITEPDHGSDWILFDSELGHGSKIVPR